MDREDYSGKAVAVFSEIKDLAGSDEFLERDSELIYETLLNRLEFTSFGDYLRRYIYRNSGLKKRSFDDVSLESYQKTIIESFNETSTPQSFEYTTARLSALAKNWLTQKTVRRKVVFLLGFGLRMSVDDVNELLCKALHEREINYKDPFEVICWYCYKNHYGYHKYESLWDKYCNISPNSVDIMAFYADATIGARNLVKSITDDAGLIYHLSKYKMEPNIQIKSVSARKHFDNLFEISKKLIVEIYNNELTSSRKLGIIEKSRRLYTIEDITEADLEHIISSAIPRDSNGNLSPAKASKLNAQFEGKRFSRQHINDILTEKAEITRYDLITLNFFIYSQLIDDYPDSKKRMIDFSNSMNEILEDCMMGELFLSNPYECFILMCLLSDTPLSAYADVWEKSYK